MPRKPQFTSFQSRDYQVAVNTLYGVWRVVRRQDDAISLLEVCNEGWSNYIKLKRVWRGNRRRFNALCAQYQFTTE
jgi:hypothetical protein